jgi:hypothetical protein
MEIKQGSIIQQTQYFIPVEIDLSVVPARLGISDFFTSRRTTVIQDLLVRHQFSLVPDNRTNVIVFCVAFFLNGDWFMQRGQTPMFAREIIYTPYFYLQKRNHVGSIDEFRKNQRYPNVPVRRTNLFPLV